MPAPGRAHSRRHVLQAAAGLAVTAVRPALAAGAPIRLTLRDDRPGATVSPYVFGANEIGVMDGGPPSAMLDRDAGIAFRRLGGDLMTGYHWVTNATHAGKNHRQANGDFLLRALQVPQADWARPAVVIEAMHGASLAMGAKSLLTLPLAGSVAADRAGPVGEAEAAPSSRFAPVRWSGRTAAASDPDPAVADIPHLLARLIDRYGDARSGRGIHGYALDNEPGLWFQTHPRLMPQRMTIRAFIERSITAAQAIKAIDPAAKTFGPCSWGATEMVSFQDAPDWPDFMRYGSFLAAYLAAFREASERAGRRLLDVLDVHWYPFSRKGKLFRTEDAALDAALLDAPRNLTEAGYREDSWVAQALQPRGADTLNLPILPSLKRLVARRFPGTEIAITEFNYGGAGRLAAGLALADALGRYASAGVSYATHWGSLDGWLNQSYRLYRTADAAGRRFEGSALAVEGADGAALSAYAALGPGSIQLVLINKSTRDMAVDLAAVTGRPKRIVSILGFDAGRRIPSAIDGAVDPGGATLRLLLPPQSARRYALA